MNNMYPFTARIAGRKLTENKEVIEHIGEETLIDCYVLGFQPSDAYWPQIGLVEVTEDIEPGSMRGRFLGSVPQEILSEEVHFPREDQSFIALGKGSCNMEDFMTMLQET